MYHPQQAGAALGRALDDALALAALGPPADPNPRVGAVVLDAAGEPVGRGFHRGAGTPHAEVEALADAARAGRDVRGGTAVVTLEPCAHTGRTGPCADALAEAGVARVVYADTDPGATSGGGAARLRSAGIAAELLHREAARNLNRPWRHALEVGRPFVTWKFATTLDGRSAAPDGSSRWITGQPARADVHARRRTVGAVIVGTGTVLADDPRLTVRDGDDRPVGVQPLRVVAGLRDVPPTARVLDGAAPTVHLRTREPAAVLDELHVRQIRHVWLEGGPTLAAAYLGAGLVDEIVAYVAPALLGSGRSALADLGAENLADLRRYDLADVARIGDDVRLVLRPLPSSQELP